MKFLNCCFVANLRGDAVHLARHEVSNDRIVFLTTSSQCDPAKLRSDEVKAAGVMPPTSASAWS
jgi:hypothetical protein